MSMTEYETTLIVRPDVGGDAVESTLDRVREVVRVGGGKLLSINHWGKKKLAYDIAKHSRGIYIHTHFLGGSSLVAELERNLRISDNVIRYLTVRLAEGVDPSAHEEKAYVMPQYDVEEAAVEEPSQVFSGEEFGAPEEDASEEEFADAEEAEEEN
jgi:small subunit ribosomal protein S6